MKGEVVLAKKKIMKRDIDEACGNRIIIFHRYHSLFFFLFQRFSSYLVKESSMKFQTNTKQSNPLLTPH